MFYFAIILFLALFGTYLLSSGNQKEARMFWRIRVGLFAISLVLVLSSCFVIIPIGKVGLPIFFGKIRDNPLSNGFHLIRPWYSVERYNIRVQERTAKARFEVAKEEKEKQKDDVGMTVHVLSVDAVDLNFDVTIRYFINPEKIPEIYTRIGLEANILPIVLDPSLRSAMREAPAKLQGLRVFGEDREEFVKRLREILNQDLGRYGIILDGDPLIRNTQLPVQVTEAVNKKITALQEAEAMNYRVQQKVLEAVQYYIEAEGIHTFQRIVSQNLSEPFLVWKGLEAVKELAKSPNTKFIVIGDKSGLPFLYQRDAAKLTEGTGELSTEEMEKAREGLEKIHRMLKDGSLDKEELEELKKKAGIKWE